MPALTQDQKLEGVRALLNPRSVAIVGASDRPGNWSMRVFQTLRRFAFPGPIYPVNPRNKTVWDGETCYPSLSDLPEAPDHVVVIVPGAAAIDTIAEAGKVKARSATVFSGGFGEGGDPKGRELAVRLRQAIDAAGLAVSGPNCLGNLAAPHRFMTIPDDRIADLELGPVAIVGQSGGIVMAIQRALAARGVKTSYAITSGNEIGLYTSDYIRYLADDPHVKVIVCFIESIRHAAEFRRACEHARKCRQTRGRGEDRRLRGKPQRGAGAYRIARGLAALLRRRRRDRRRDPRRDARRGGRGRGIFRACTDRRKVRGSAA